MALSDYQVLTPERVSLQYDIAGIGSRGAAAIIDAILQWLLITVAFLAIAGGAVVAHAFGDAPGVVNAVFVALFAIAFFALTAGYHMLFEIIWSGQTPGKRVIGVRVLRENGYPIRPVDSVIRNLVRVVDALPFIYAVGVLTMLTNSRAKRLGDFAAGTIVVREGGRGAVAPPELAPDTITRGPTLRREDATLVRDFLLRRSGMASEARRALALRLATALATRYSLTFEADPEAFLESLAV